MSAIQTFRRKARLIASLTNGIYDREDGRMHAFNNTTRTRTISEKFTVEIFLRYDFMDGKFINFKRYGIYIPEKAGGIEASIEEND